MKQRKLTATDLELAMRWIIIALCAVAAAKYLREGDRVSLAAAGLTVFLLLLPPLLARLLRVFMPISFRLVWWAFIFAAMYLGELHSFFYRFLWWDDMLHTASAMLVTYGGLILLFLLNRDPQIDSKLRPGYIALILVCFTLAFGAAWELFEFSADRLLGVNMLKGRDSTLANSVYDMGRALVNTMQDLALDLLGAILVAITAWWLLRAGKLRSSAFGVPLRQFIEANPNLFRARASAKIAPPVSRP